MYEHGGDNIRVGYLLAGAPGLFDRSARLVRYLRDLGSKSMRERKARRVIQCVGLVGPRPLWVRRRVETLRYSRMTCPSCKGSCPARASRWITSSARSCPARPSSVAVNRMFVSSIARNGALPLVGGRRRHRSTRGTRSKCPGTYRVQTDRGGGARSVTGSAAALSRISSSSCCSECPCFAGPLPQG